MNRNLLIIGAGIYGLVAKEIARSMNCFAEISFVDDATKQAPDGTPVIGTTADLNTLSQQYGHAVVAIGNPKARLSILRNIEKNTALRIATLISPQAYVSPSARIGSGSIIEPMAVLHTGCALGLGCIISAGAVVNHAASCHEGVHVDCNATVAGYRTVPAGTKVPSGSVFQL